MAQFPALPLWTDAYLGDTTHLTTIEHGAYLLLLIAMWRSDGSLPNDDRLLARYAKLTPGQWKRIKPILWPFFKVEGDRITQGRLTDEAIVVRQKSKQQSDKARSRWLKTKETADATAMPMQCPEDAPTPTPIEEDKSSSPETKKPARKTRIKEAATITDNMRRYASDRKLSDREALAQFDKFKNDAIAKGKTFADWDRAFVTWLDSPYFKPVFGQIDGASQYGAFGKGEMIR